ncbi:related to ankyrin 3 [Fusarium mangiferae]|uniref:Related to ankyrin 3 n=1 Tax=Fusarium mangiferae TaxID=192010 RepID=A0A1L7TJA3_FUSMA|nr:uncharacterized protein FMAN_13182 [Fusarium mangiferae]CVK94886.1 related to ankyrin 3 [Fusarium mangiferae]
MASFETSQSWLPNRQRADSGDDVQSLQYDDYTVGWISALPLEMTAAQAMLDHGHEPLRQHPQDSNCYEFGTINGHHVVIACLPKAQYGNNNAAIVANNMHRTFPHLQHRLLVGIAGGAPGVVDVRLGDVVVSTDAIQYDLGKALPDNHFQRIAKAISPPQALLTVVSKLEASHIGGQSRMPEILAENVARLPHYSHPMVEDRLFHHECPHNSSDSNCDSCNISQLIIRRARQQPNPVIHYGRIASGNQVIKDALTRDKISKETNSICFEMEAAGVMDAFPCLVIRGICDYSDSHKNKGWQEYAALIAAAYAKELLMSMPPALLQSRKRVRVQKHKVSEPISPDAYECLQAMFVTDSSLDREGIIDAKGDICEGTCEWILSTEEFQAWDQNPPHLLWISAPPGMGKTFMAIFLSKHLEALSENLSGVATIFFFCDNKVDTRNTAVSILRGLMYQLISRQPHLVNEIIPQWKQKLRGIFQESSFGALWKLFEEMITESNFRTIYCIVDGLDECEPNSLSLLLRKLERLSRGSLGSSIKMKLICLSRKYPENIPEALLLFTKMELDTMTARKVDISCFISSQVQELVQKKSLSGKMRSHLEKTFHKKSEETFLWISFMSQDLQQQRSLDFEACLDSLPTGLDAVYERILENVDFRKLETIRSILYWILVAKRPFTISELCEAADIKSTGFLTHEEVCIELIKSCGHLLQIVDKYMRTSVQRTVTFLHQSAKDYLMKFDPRFGSQIRGLAQPQLHEHATITLIQYLEKINSQYGSKEGAFYNIAKDFPLVYYAVEEWSFHFRELEDISQVMRPGVSFFEKDSKARHMWQNLDDLPEVHYDFEPVPLLHLSVLLDLDSLAEWCLGNDGEHDVETKWGIRERTALVLACEQRQEHIVSLLLDAGAIPLADIYSESALDMALSFCNRRILHLMAQTEPCREFLIANAANQDGALIYVAAKDGNEDACRFLVEDFGWDLKWQSGSVGHKALACALSSGNLKLISCFIREWHVPIRNHSGVLKEMCTSMVFQIKFEQAIRFLVDDCSIDINITDAEGHNALFFIFQDKYRTFSPIFMIRTLLEFGCSPGQLDRFGRAPMHYLVMAGTENDLADFSNIMDVLVDMSQYDVNQVCLKGQTILHYLIERLVNLQPDQCVGVSFLEFLSMAPGIAKAILNLGVDRHIQNSKGFTSLQVMRAALGQCERKITRRLREYMEAVNNVTIVLGSYCTVPKH